MRLTTLFIFFCQVLDVKTAVPTKPPVEVSPVEASPVEVSGDLGGTVKLRSFARPSWRLTKIEWSIFTNNTWIATYIRAKTITDHVLQYKGRLSLNTTTGDLTIRNLIASDAREYNVDLHSSDGEDAAHKIKLTVKERFQQPSVRILGNTSIEKGCLVVMECYSPENGVDLSWKFDPLNVLAISRRNSSNGSEQLLAFVNTAQNVTCISSRNSEQISFINVTAKCDVLNGKTQPSPPTVQPSRTRFSFIFLVGGFVGGGLVVIIIYLFGEKIKSACQHLKNKCSPA